MKVKVSRLDTASLFKGEESQMFLLDDAFESGDAGYLAHAFGVFARARGMTQIAKDAGVTREALYKSLSMDGDPRLSTLLGVMKALNLRFKVVSVAAGGKEDDNAGMAAE